MDGRKIFHNTLLLTLTESLAKLMSFFLIMAVARKLGPELMGIYAFGVAFVGIFQIFVNFGLEPFIQREVGRHPEIAGQLMAQAFVLKLIIYSASVVFVLIFGLLVADNELKRNVVWILTVVMFFQTNLTATNAFFRAKQKAKYEASVRMGMNLIYTSAGLVAVISGRGLLTLVSLELLAQAVACFLAWYIFIKKIAKPTQLINTARLVELIHGSWKFSLIRVVQTVFNSIDLVMLSFMAGDLSTGYYSVAVRFTAAFGFLPRAFSGAFLPVISLKAVENLSEFNTAFKPYFKYLLLLGIGLGILILGLSKEFILLLFGQNFLPATQTLGLMAVALAFTFANWPLSNAIIALDKENQMLQIFSFCAGANIILNIILIPYLMDKGAACATILSQCLLFVLQRRVLGKKMLKTINLKILSLGPILSGMFTLLFIYIISYYSIGFLWKLIATGLIFICFTFITKTLRISDLIQAKSFLAMR